MAYNRVNWQSGTKVSDGYVEIDGTQHTVVQPVYQGPTPINPAGLNIMDAGIKENSDMLNGNIPIKNIFVEDIECKNLFNINGEVNIQVTDGSVVSRNTVSNNILTANCNSWTQYSAGQKFTNLANKTITVSAKIVSTGTGQYGRIYIHDNGTQIAAQNGIANDIITLTVTPTSNNVIISFATTGDTQAASGTGAQFTDIQVEFGSQKTDYVEHKRYGYTIQDLFNDLFASYKYNMEQTQI